MRIFTEELQQMIDKRSEYDTAWDYYDGGVPEMFASAKLRKLLKGDLAHLEMNYARTVVTALVNRLEISSIAGASEKSNKAIANVLEKNSTDALFNDLFVKASVFGQAFVMAWPDGDGAGDWRLSVHDPRNTFIKYNDEQPWVKDFVIRVWQSGEQVRMNVMYADRIEKYVANSVGLEFALDWTRLETIVNPFNEIPVFHFRNDADQGRPEHLEAYSPQNAINKLITTHMYTVDYQGSPQRYALSNIGDGGEPEDFDEDSTERQNAEAMKAGPGELWYLKGVDAVGEFGAAPPQIFWEPIKDLVQTMASLTDTPGHYFNKSTVLSGSALRAAEAPLLKKAQRRQRIYGGVLAQLFSFILRVEKAKSDISIDWAVDDSIDELELWDLLAKKRNVGMPLRQVLTEAGYSSAKIDEILVWATEEQALELETYKRSTPTVRVQQDNDENNVDAAPNNTNQKLQEQ